MVYSWRAYVEPRFGGASANVGYAEDASYEIWAGDELLGSVMVDQSHDPAADFVTGNTNFQSLGDSWAINDGPILVLLSNVISVYGKRVMADAIRIAQFLVGIRDEFYDP